MEKVSKNRSESVPQGYTCVGGGTVFPLISQRDGLVAVRTVAESRGIAEFKRCAYRTGKAQRTCFYSSSVPSSSF